MGVYCVLCTVHAYCILCALHLAHDTLAQLAEAVAAQAGVLAHVLREPLERAVRESR
jgi:hypothetical protein